mgnify:CR=1 FL=1
MKIARKIVLFTASTILTCLGLSSCKHMIQPLEYGVPFTGAVETWKSNTTNTPTDNGPVKNLSKH